MLVVVAEILLNRLLHTGAFDFSRVSAVVMDEFHASPTWSGGSSGSLTLGPLPHTCGRCCCRPRWAIPWSSSTGSQSSHKRRLDLVQGAERKVPLLFQWVPDMLLNEQIESMVAGDDEARKTPALIFSFNREECWNIAEQLKGKKVLSGGQQARLEELKQYDFSDGAGPEAAAALACAAWECIMRACCPNIGGWSRTVPAQAALDRRVHGNAFGRHQSARPLGGGAQLLKGPPGKQKLLEPSTAHQIFGRAGRPQFDKQGYVFVLAHEDDVKIARWREKYDQIPEDTKDPGLMRMKKDLKRKMPTRRENQQYWNEQQFDKLRTAEAGQALQQRRLPWRLPAYMLDASPEVDLIRRLVGKRLMDSQPHRGRPARPGPDADDALAGGLRDARAGAAAGRGIGAPAAARRRREGRG